MSAQDIRVLDKTDANMLVQHDDGRVENISLSPLNRLLFDHGLWGLLRDGSEILKLGEGDREVTIIPGDDAREYTLDVGDTEPLQLGEHQKSALVDALMECYDGKGDRDPQPLLRLYDNLRSDMVRHRVINPIGENEPFASRITKREDGWFINDHLLLTWNNEFIHPGTTSRSVRGSGVREGASENAYQVTLSGVGDFNRSISMNGETFRLTNAEMEFIARAMWAITKAPKN